MSALLGEKGSPDTMSWEVTKAREIIFGKAMRKKGSRLAIALADSVRYTVANLLQPIFQFMTCKAFDEFM